MVHLKLLIMGLKTKKTHYEFSLFPDTYPVSIHVVYSNDAERVAKFFRKQTKEPNLELICERKEDLSNARVSRWKEHLLFEFDPASGRGGHEFAGLVAHEATHAVYKMEDYLGNIMHQGAQEPHAYLVQYLVQNICNKIWGFIHKSKRK